MKNFKNFVIENANEVIGGKGRPDFAGGRPDFTTIGNPALELVASPIENVSDLLQVAEQAEEQIPALADLLPTIADLLPEIA